MQKDNELLNELTTLIINTVNLHHIDRKTISSETSLREGGLELDSVDLLELIVTIEHQYGLKVADAEVGKMAFRNIGSIAKLIQQHRSLG